MDKTRFHIGRKVDFGGGHFGVITHITKEGLRLKMPKGFALRDETKLKTLGIDGVPFQIMTVGRRVRLRLIKPNTGENNGDKKVHQEPGDGKDPGAA